MTHLASPFLATALFLLSNQASAQSIIKQDSRHPSYKLELEPHLALGWVRPPGDAGGLGLGGGLRFAIPVADRGFVDGVNDSVAVSFGFDLLKHGGGGVMSGRCAEYVGTGDDRICVRVESAGGSSLYVELPVAMQWNFFLTDDWSVFAEPGLGVYFQIRDVDSSVAAGVFPVFELGGRYHFSKKTTLTMRVGYPHVTVGLSFLL